MRHDQVGFFWEDVERVSVWANKHNREKAGGPVVLPPVPETGWRIPTSFPDLTHAKSLCIDTETYDPNLLESGPSMKTGGYLVGISVATEDASWYFPMRHTIGENMDPEAVIAWAKYTFSLPMPKIFHSAMYDIGWLENDGIHVNGKIHDISFAEPLIDEESVEGYSLNAISNKYGVGEKEEGLLYDWLSKAYGGPATRKAQGKNIHRAPASLVGPYAQQDSRLPQLVLEKQLPILRAEGLEDLYNLECRTIRPLLYMRERGVPVDVKGAEKAVDFLSGKINDVSKTLGGINIYAAEDIADFCDRNNIGYQTTEKGNPSFVSTWLENHTDARIQAISTARKYTKARDTFVKGYILDKHVNGRLYCLFHPLRGDENGTVSGRFSSSLPNLQNIPARDPVIGPMLRSMFIPDKGKKWVRFDWSQIEYRLLVHYAQGEGSDVARSMYCDNPETDFHVYTAELTGLERKPAKNINFGLVYGMAKDTLARHLGRTLDEAEPIFEAYHGTMPFVQHTNRLVSERAQARGYIKTILNRRRRFNSWEPTKWGGREQALPEALAREKWGKIRRAHTHKALNALLQGSAADLMKLAFVTIWEEGLIDNDLMLYLLVHDEFDFGVPEELYPRIARIKEIMETCLPLKVPVLTEVEYGINWGCLSRYEP